MAIAIVDSVTVSIGLEIIGKLQPILSDKLEERSISFLEVISLNLGTINTSSNDRHFLIFKIYSPHAFF